MKTQSLRGRILCAITLGSALAAPDVSSAGTTEAFESISGLVRRFEQTAPEMTLADAAELTAGTGCVCETLGAILTTERSGVMETEEAELAWSFVAWAIAEERRGRSDAQGTTERVTAAIERGIAAARSLDAREEERGVAEQAIAEIVMPSLAALRARIATRDPASEPPFAI